ncbi:MAG: DNA repair protein RecO [Anaerolineales bacterium]|jgi:DNA repair protein RecO (recombination protein O)
MSNRDRAIRTEGIILRRRDFGESDRILVVFTRKLGRISAIAKGSRKPSSKIAGHLEVFMRSSFLISRGRNLHLITQAEVLESFDHLREDLTGIGIGSYVVELVDAVTYEEGSNLKLYDLLAETLRTLDSGLDPAVILHYFELHLLGLSGFRPELFICVECGKNIVEQDQYLSGQLGGVVCPSCLHKVAGADIKPVSSRTLKYLRHFQRSNIKDLANLQVPDDIKGKLEDAIRYYLDHTLEGPLNSPDFINRVGE